jgi:hypothetical protein
MIQRLGAARFTALAVLASTVISTLLHLPAHAAGRPCNQPVPVYAYAAAMSLFSTILPVFMLAACHPPHRLDDRRADRNARPGADRRLQPGYCSTSRFPWCSWQALDWYWQGCGWSHDVELIGAPGMS